MPSSDPFLKELLSQPTAPFREGLVQDLFRLKLTKLRVPFFEDPGGNLVLGVRSRAEYLARVRKVTSEPVRIFMAHMDHPGFHGIRWKTDRTLDVRWFGGSPFKHLAGTPVWLATREGWAGEGTLSQPRFKPGGKGMVAAVVRVPAGTRKRLQDASSLFGSFRFRAPVWSKGPLLYSKAADDLVGAYVVFRMAVAMRRSPSYLGLLTRAEEVGLLGAIGHFDLGWLRKARRPVVAISLETSRTFPGAEIGKGPVVRLGDRATTFDPGALQVLTELARQTLPGAHQRRIMDGGTCEATVSTAFGFPTIGISVPLGNYHNQSYQGGPDSRGPLGPAPEFVHCKDIDGMEKLCQALLRPGLTWGTPWGNRLREFRQMRKAAKTLLDSL